MEKLKKILNQLNTLQPLSKEKLEAMKDEATTLIKQIRSHKVKMKATDLEHKIFNYTSIHRAWANVLHAIAATKDEKADPQKIEAHAKKMFSIMFNLGGDDQGVLDLIEKLKKELAQAIKEMKKK